MSRTVRPSVTRTGRGRTYARNQSPTRYPAGQGTPGPGPGRGRGRGQGQAQGRGRGQGRGVGRGMDPGGYNQAPEAGPGDGEQDHGASGSQPQNAEGRMQSRGAYTVISPNEKKRREIQSQAQREENMYKEHKERQKVGHVSYVGTIGGGQVTEADSRRAQPTERQAAFNRRQKSQQYKADAKRREEEEYGQKKAEQRKKAQTNAQRESDRKAALDADRRRKNEAFLARYDQQNRQKKTAKVLSSSAATAMATREHQDEDGGATVAGTDHHHSNHPLPANEESDTNESPMETLQREFPYLSEDFIHDILFQVNGNLSRARELLS